jgi:hypothetical protein
MTRLSASEDDLLVIHQDDDAWFKANPNRSYRLRRAYAIEAGSAKQHAGPPASKISYVIIGQIPGRQVRRVVQFACEIIDTEELARALFDQFIARPEGRNQRRLSRGGPDLTWRARISNLTIG